MVNFIKPKDARKVLITSALPYVNNVPHLGNLIGCVLSADVFSRYCKLKKYDSLYVCGTDEHGTATEAKALEEGITPQEICDKYYKIHSDIYKWFNIEFDVWGRTSTKAHERITQEIFLKIKKNGYVHEKKVEQLFCRQCSKFLADRFVEGECPHCSYAHAGGDQCDKCQKLLNAVELLSPKCKVCSSTPDVRESEHLFLDLEKLQNKLVHWVEDCKLKGFWTENAISTTEKWLKQGLKPRAITRDLKWGVSVPLEKYKDKVFYVWFDAPIGYISITANAREDWQEWWHGRNVQLFQFMAKDNIPFHTIMFPASLIATGEEWTMLHHINSTEYLNYESGKFSKSRGEGVFGDDAMNTGIPADCWRYYLLTSRPESADSAFVWKEFQERINNELVANFANLVNRTVVFISRFFGGRLCRQGTGELLRKDRILKIEELYEEVKLRNALHEIMLFSKEGNKYFQEKQPWNLIKQDRDACESVMSELYHFVRDLSILLWPYLPKTAEQVWSQLGLDKQSWKNIATVVSDVKIGTPELLFSKIEDVTHLQERFSGTQNERNAKVNAGPAKDSRQVLKSEQLMIFRRLQLKVAEVISVKEHPKADKLLVLQIDIGEAVPRQLVAGLKKHYSKQDIVGKKLVVVSNLAPALLRGEKSDGMLLAAGDGDNVGVLSANTSPNGSLVYTDSAGKDGLPEGPVRIEEFSGLSMESKAGFAWFLAETLKTDREPVSVDRNIEGKIS